MRGWVMVSALVFAVFGSGVGPAAAGCVSGEGVRAPKEKVPFRDGEYRRAGPTLVCSFRPKPGEPEPDLDAMTAAICHHIGPLQIDMPIEQARERLGTTPVKVQPAGEGRAEIHLITGPDRQPIGYWVLYTDGRRLTAIQETAAREGWQTPLPHAFSSIRPGDPVQRVLDVLGTPAQRCTGPGTVGELWNWGVHHISMEVAQGRVFSIKLDRIGPSRGKGI